LPKFVDVIRVRVEELKDCVISKKSVLNGWEMRTAKHLGPNDYEFPHDDWKNLDVGDIWARQGETTFMRRTVTIPTDWAGCRVGLELVTGGEGLLRINGEPSHGVDDNRGYILIEEKAKGGDTYECEVEAKTGGYLDFVVEDASKPYIFSVARLIAVDKPREEAWYDFRVVYEAAAAEKDSTLQEAILLAMKDALLSVDFRDKSKPEFDKALQAARQILWKNLSEIKFGDCGGKIFYTGHSHIDIAWLWPLKETMRKVGRTYSTVMALMDEFPDYYFGCTQVPLYLYLKEHFPSIYEKVKARVKEGRFEPVGGTWLENDCNLVSGESLVRQSLYGQRFFKKEFGVDIKVGWLVDAFGFSGALPQIYQKSGLKYFMTSKINWNDTNRLPFQTFWWEGIDGSRLLTQFIHGTYNARVIPEHMQEVWENYNSKLDSPELLASFGYGDGGGGPTRRMLEYLPRLKDIPGLPKAVTGRVDDYFDRVAESTKEKNLPVWKGELYLEYHRGVYTSQAWNKRWNRQSELLYREVEMLSSFNTLFGASYPKESIYSNWQTILLNQFHDILPGSSINEVYVDSRKQYESVISTGNAMRRNALESLAEKIDTSGEGKPIVVFNSLSWMRSGLVELAGVTGCVVDADGTAVPQQKSGDGIAFLASDVPSCGYAVYRLVEKSEEQACPFEVRGLDIQTPYYELTLSADGNITRLYDLWNEREVIPEGARANVLQVFEDKPADFEAWDVELQYQDKMWEFSSTDAPKVLEIGPARLVLGVNLKYGQSTISQKIVFYDDTPRIDFVNEADWQDRKMMVKVAFPVEVRSTYATYEIAFGTIERPNHWNTSWDKARFEVSGQKWTDLSEAGYGVSVLNDCKYGWDIKDNMIRLSLLRAPEYPDPEADKGNHEFTYSLLPHAGDWRNGTVQEGYDLNVPLQAVLASAHSGPLKDNSHAFLTMDAPNVVVDTVKQAEDSSDMIFRVYEAYGGRGPATLSFDRPIASATECNLLEEEDAPVDLSGQEIKFAVKPYEIRTFKVRFA